MTNKLHQPVTSLWLMGASKICDLMHHNNNNKAFNPKQVKVV
uniref:Uncharacterized protein n=1 Tax=Arundo donax TaxID=35708 RepID=A0A0A9FCE9_ARUDO